MEQPDPMSCDVSSQVELEGLLAFRTLDRASVSEMTCWMSILLEDIVMIVLVEMIWLE